MSKDLGQDDRPLRIGAWVRLKQLRPPRKAPIVKLKPSSIVVIDRGQKIELTLDEIELLPAIKPNGAPQ